MRVTPCAGRRKLRTVGPNDVPDDLVLLIRACPASTEDAVEDMTIDALQSGRIYAVLGARGDREPLFGVSVFALRDLVGVADLLARFDDAPTYLEAPVGDLPSAGFVVHPTGIKSGPLRRPAAAGSSGGEGEPVAEVRAAAARLVTTAQGLRPNPAYAGRLEPLDEEDGEVMPTSPWVVEQVDEELVEKLAARHVPNPRAVQLGVDIVGDTHREDDDGLNWARLSDARRVEDVVPGSAVVLGSSIGRYLAKVVAWDFEVSDDDPIITVELLPLRPSDVAKLLERNRTSVA